MTIKGTCLCGAIGWEFDGDPGPVTACNCTACRRYGALWAYDYLDERIRLSGETRGHWRKPGESPLGFHFCPNCGCLSHWLARGGGPDGRRRMAVNVRLAEDPAVVASLPIEHFDGLTTFRDLGQDGRCVRDMWA